MAALSKYTFDADGTTVTPVNDRFLFSWERENETAFFRRLVKTKFLFRGADYEYLKTAFDADPCASVPLTISRSGWEWMGKLELSKGDWDLDRCELEITPEPDDDFNCFVGEIKKTFNLLDYGTRIDAEPFFGTVETITCNYSGTAPLFSGLVYYGACWPVPDQDFYQSTLPHTTARWRPLSTVKTFTSSTNCDITTVWMREKVTHVGTPPGGGWVNVSGNDWVRSIPYTGFSETTTANGYGSNDYESEAVYLDETLENGRSFMEVLEEIVTGLDCDIDGIRSNFFSYNASGASPSNSAYTQAADKLAQLLFFQKSDIVTPTATGKATKLEITLEDCLKILRECCNVFWSIEVDGANKYLRLEHFSWYEDANNGTDWTADAPDYIAGTNRWTESETVPQLEKFSFVQHFNADFGEMYIEFAAGCANKGETREHQPPQTITDIAGIWGNADAGLEGICPVACYEDSGTTYILQANNDLNGDMSFLELVKRYYANGMYADDFYFSGGPFSAVSVRKRKKQVQIQVPLCFSASFDEAFDAAELQRTGLGWGEVVNAQWDSLTEILTLNIKQA